MRRTACTPDIAPRVGPIVDEAMAEAWAETRALLKGLMVEQMLRQVGRTAPTVSQPSAPSERGLYVYGIVASGDGFDPTPGIDPSAPTFLVQEGDVAAVVSEVSLGDFDEEQFAGSGIFLFGTILERFFGLYSSINSFSTLAARSNQRKRLVHEWPARSG